MTNGWRTKTLEEVCQFSNGLWKGEKPPFVNIGVIRNTNFTKDGTLDDSDIAYLDVEVRKLEKRRLQYGDIILEKSGGGPKQPVGRVVLFDKIEGDFSFSNFTSALRVLDPRELDFRFLHKLLFWTHLSGVTEGMQSHSTGIRNLDGDAYKAIKINFPPLPEQQRIVGVLDEAFASLATAKANAEKNLQNARALFESHLQSVFTQLGKRWEAKPLEGLATIRTGKRDANHQVENGPYPFYTCAFGQFKSPTFSFDGPSIILPGNGANVGKVFFHDGKFEAYQRTYVVNELSQAINPRFLYFCFSANWPGWISTKQFGSATNYIVVGDLKAFPVPTPPLSVQEATVAQLESFSEQAQRLASIYEQKLGALEALKKSLLHHAFTGQLK